MKNKGIKVKHRRRHKFKPKRKGKRVVNSVIWATVICVALFFGYSVLAPFIDWLRNREPYVPDENKQPVITTATEVTDEIDSSGEIPVSLPFTKGYYLSADDLKSVETLTAALSAIPNGYTEVVLPLKSKGGNINFLTVNETALTAHAVTGTLPLSDICQNVQAAGFNPIAEIDLLNDNIYPQTFGDTSYFLGSGSRWYDNNPANGGKPWLSPYSAGTKTYLTALSSEIATAGFKDLILSGAEFPPFRDSDLNIISSDVKSADRYSVIFDIITGIKTAAGENVKTTVTVGADKVFSGKEDIFNDAINSTGDINYRIVFDLSQLKVKPDGVDISDLPSAERFQAAAEYIKSNFSKVNFTAVLTKDGLTDAEISACEDIAKQLEILEFCIK